MRAIFQVLICIGLLGISSGAYAEKNKSVREEFEMIPWEQVNEILPKYTKFTVRDLETGMEFNVQRRAGSQHADVQPLTSKDTKIMKKIYDGKWSWKRRAIVVLHDNQQIAASMHGMPHGAGALKNNFPGHFCIHFYGSTTHRTNYMDLSHKLMILKAAGKLESHLHSADPYEVTSAFIAGFKERDKKIVSQISLQKRDWDDILPTIENVSLTRMPVLPAEDLKEELSLTVLVEINWHIKNVGMKNYRGNIKLIRLSIFDGWKVDTDHFLEQNGLVS